MGVAINDVDARCRQRALSAGLNTGAWDPSATCADSLLGECQRVTALDALVQPWDATHKTTGMDAFHNLCVEDFGRTSAQCRDVDAMDASPACAARTAAQCRDVAVVGASPACRMYQSEVRDRTYAKQAECATAPCTVPNTLWYTERLCKGATCDVAGADAQTCCVVPAPRTATRPPPAAPAGFFDKHRWVEPVLIGTGGLALTAVAAAFTGGTAAPEMAELTAAAIESSEATADAADAADAADDAYTAGTMTNPDPAALARSGRINQAAALGRIHEATGTIYQVTPAGLVAV